MIKKNATKDTGIVRKKAEALMNTRKHVDTGPFSEADLIKLSNELELHQIELEIINDELRKAKEQAEVTSQKYAELYYAPLGYFTLSKPGEIIDVNPTGSKMLGREQKDLLNTPIYDYITVESRVIFDLFIKKIFRSGIIQTCDLTLRIKDKGTIYLYMNGLASENNFQCQLIAIDISERKKAENEYQRVLNELSTAQAKLNVALESGNIGIWEWDSETGEITLDNRAEKLFGIKSGKFGKKITAFMDHVHIDDVPVLRVAFNKALKKDIPIEAIIRNRNNPVSKFLSIKAHIKKDMNGKPVRFTGVCLDVTAAMETERTITHLNEELKRSNKDLEHFAYVASHDLQEPLRMVTSFVQLLSMKYEGKLDQDAKAYIDYAVEGSKRMYELLNGLLTYSRLTRGRDHSKVDMNRILIAVKDNLKLLIQERDAMIESEILPVIMADNLQMVQLLQNLIENAIKFSPGQPKIFISAKTGKDEVIFTVKDEGMGIDPMYNAKIFEIFQRLLPRQQVDGVGIGLAICKKIIERHGGRIWIESEPGKGSEFNFTIPVVPDE